MEENNTFNLFFEYHILFQKGIYINNEIVLDNISFYHSNIILDSDWNFFRINNHDYNLKNTVLSIKKVAQTLNRKPTLNVIKGSKLYNDINAISNLSKDYEYWMYAKSKNITEIIKPYFVTDLKIQSNSNPSDDFLEVFGSMFFDEEINSHFKKFYNKALKESKIGNLVEVKHLVAYEDEKPIACASVFQKDGVIGLYNVGTVYDYQKKGVGKWISSIACKSFSEKDYTVFLQCVTEGHVPSMYKEIGFDILLTNSLINLG